ncbi:cytochrome c biogenesis protein CcdA, partial [Sphingobacterium haloxyli]
SFFTKQSGSRARGISRALLYGLFIIVIYVALGMLITIAFGSDALNALSTNGVFNFLFFLILVVFAASFFGAFELTLPSSFVNRI